MSKMDMTFWEPFTLESLFDIVKGTRLTKNDMKEGDINYIGASAFNNGITYKIGNNEHVHPAGLLTVCYNGSIGTTFYQPEPFWATDDVNVLYPKFEMTPYIGMFIAPLIRRVGLNYAYTDKWQIEDMKKSHIYLPIDKNDKPDWAYMDAYMRKIDNRAKKNLDCLQSAITPPRISNKITVSSWKKFSIKDMFEANNTGNILIRDIEDGSGSTPYVTASGVNNGVAAMINASRYELIKGNCILVGGKTFTLTYQKEDFVSNDSHNFEMHLKNIEGNCYIYLYLIAVLRATLGNRYFWGDAVTKDKIMADEILLPCDDSKQPNWDYMEAYMETIHNKAISNLDNIEYNS